MKMNEKSLAIFNTKFNVNPTTNCWEWKIPIWAKFRYGTFSVKGKYKKAHIASYEHFNNTLVPYGIVVRHKCNNSCCVNPEHLVLGTQIDNAEDMFKSGRAYIHVSRETVDKIIEDYKTGNFTTRQLAAKYGCSNCAVSKYINGKRRRRELPIVEA